MCKFEKKIKTGSYLMFRKEKDLLCNNHDDIEL